MFSYVKEWIGRENSKKDLVQWNSAKASGLKTDILRQENYVKKMILMIIGGLIGLLSIIKRLRKCSKIF